MNTRAISRWTRVLVAGIVAAIVGSAPTAVSQPPASPTPDAPSAGDKRTQSQPTQAQTTKSQPAESQPTVAQPSVAQPSARVASSRPDPPPVAEATPAELAGGAATRPAPLDWSHWRKRRRELIELASTTRPRVVLLGDSITDSWTRRGAGSWAERLAPLGAANFGIAGERTQSLLYRLTQGDYDTLDPRVVVVLIGTNNLKEQRNTPAETAAGVERVVAECRARFANAQVLLVGVLPCGADPNDAHARGVAAVNRRIERLATLDRVRFLDTSDAFVTPAGEVDPEQMPDYLHPSASGYERLAQRLAPAITDALDHE